MYGPGVKVGNWLETALSEEVSARALVHAIDIF